MGQSELSVVTGATGYTGKYITRRLLAMGQRVISLTGHPGRQSPFGVQVPVIPFNFDKPSVLAESLHGATTLYNTYWVRFVYGRTTFETAVENTRTLLWAARHAGVRKFVHMSIANTDSHSTLPYYRGKGLLEEAVMNSGLSYAIVRPTVIFGPEDILINNIAWLLRHFPLFAIPVSGAYRVQPVFVEDVANLAVDAALQDGDVVIEAIGPEIFTFRELVGCIAMAIQSRAQVVHVPSWLALRLSRAVGWTMHDVMLTPEEMEGLLAGLLVSSASPTGRTRFSEWLQHHATVLGIRYASELHRHYR